MLQKFLADTNPQKINLGACCRRQLSVGTVGSLSVQSDASGQHSLARQYARGSGMTYRVENSLTHQHTQSVHPCRCGRVPRR